MIKEELEKIGGRSREFASEAREKTVGYIAAAFGLVAGLAWNDAIKSLIDYVFPFQQGGILIKFVYAILVTLVVVLIVSYGLKFLSRKDKAD